MRLFTLLLLGSSTIAFAASTSPALTYSTYLRDGFTPKAIATDSAGNIYLAGNAIVDPATSQSTVLVVKLNPQGTQYVYVRYFGGSVQDSATAIAVDSTGNAYIAGSTTSPDFPVSGGGSLGTAPSASSPRSFVVKLDNKGGLVFSDLLGGSTGSVAQAVAVNAAGQVVVSGMVSNNPGPAFPTTSGAYSIANTANHPYLLELDATGTKVVFSATGIGGSALAVDGTGNIYVAGSTTLLDYPTTPGTYQPTLPAFQICQQAPCSAMFQGANQYVTKVDPTGSKLVYSTAVSGKGNTTNAGVAVDAAGNVYLTGYAGQSYPYTVGAPSIPIGPVNATFFYELPFLTKLDAAGRTLLFSVPVGGAGVQVDSRGSAYVSGGAGTGLAGGFGIGNNLPALADLPTVCLPNGFSVRSVAYVAQIDASSGELRGSQFLGGSSIATSGIALVGSTPWVAGTTNLADFPLTPNAVTLPNIPASRLAGAYLGAVDFTEAASPTGAPQVGCVVDSADLTPAGAAVRSQLLTIFGKGLGPVEPVAASDNTTSTLAGVNISVGGVAAPLLYVSATQVNFAVPLVESSQSFATMQLTVDGVNAAARRLPLTFSNPSLFVDITQQPVPSFGAIALAMNADGSKNSPANPAALGSEISVFVNGIMRDPRQIQSPPQLLSTNGWSVTAIDAVNPFVSRVRLRAPSPLVNNFSCPTSLCEVGFTLYEVGFVSNGQVAPTGEAFGGVVYINRTQ